MLVHVVVELVTVQLFGHHPLPLQAVFVVRALLYVAVHFFRHFSLQRPEGLLLMIQQMAWVDAAYPRRTIEGAACCSRLKMGHSAGPCFLRGRGGGWGGGGGVDEYENPSFFMVRSGGSCWRLWRPCLLRIPTIVPHPKCRCSRGIEVYYCCRTLAI